MESHLPWDLRRTHLLIGANLLAVIVVFVDRWTGGFSDPLFVVVYGGLSAGALALAIGLTDSSPNPVPETGPQPGHQTAREDSGGGESADRENRAARRENLLRLADAFEKNLDSVLSFVSTTSADTQKSASSLTAAAKEASSLTAAAAQISNESVQALKEVVGASGNLSVQAGETSREVTRSVGIATKAVTEAHETKRAMQGLADKPPASAGSLVSSAPLRGKPTCWHSMPRSKQRVPAWQGRASPLLPPR